MFKLTIKKSDGSIYWIEYFNSQEELDRWLATEKTRSYWVSTYTSEVADLRRPVDPELEAENVAKEKKRNDARSRLGTLDWEKVKTVADVKAVIRDLIDKD